MNRERINRLNSDLNSVEKKAIFANDKVDAVIAKIFDTNKQIYIVEGDVRIRQEFNYFIDIINVTLDDKRIIGKKLTLDNDVQINGDFYLSGDQILSGKIESDNWGAGAGGQIDLANGTLKFGGSSAPKVSIASTGVLNCSSAVVSGSITITGGSGIANLTDAGALAVKDSVAYGEITGTKPPSNADVTLTALNGELSLTGGGLVLASGGAKIRGGQTAYDTGSGFWIGDVSGTSKFSIGNSVTGKKFTWDGTNLNMIVSNITITAGSIDINSSTFKVTTAGALTATSADITGKITADEGFIGGWTIGANKISIAGIDIDQANSRIKVYTGSNYVEMKPAGLFGYDSVLGTTVKIPTNGDAPEFSKGIIKEFIYEIYTSGVIRTNVNPAVNGGMLINNATMTGYAPASGGARFFVDYAGSNPGDVKIGDYTNSKGLFWDQSAGTFNMKGIFTVKGGTIEDTLTMGASGKIDLGSGSELTKSHLYLTQIANSIQMGSVAGYHLAVTVGATDLLMVFSDEGAGIGYIGVTDAYPGKFDIAFSQVQMAATITGINVASNKWTFSDNTSVIGGVTASNLVDKSTSEIITGVWSFANGLYIEEDADLLFGAGNRILWNSVQERYEFYIDDVLEGYVDSTGFHNA